LTGDGALVALVASLYGGYEWLTPLCALILIYCIIVFIRRRLRKRRGVCLVVNTL
jgi:hypothetical protein